MSEEALKAEIARLTGAINRHKSGAPTTRRNATYVNPSYRPLPKPQDRSSQPSHSSAAPGPSSAKPASRGPAREVVIDGVAFQSSGRSLIRKDLAQNIAQAKPKTLPKPVHIPTKSPYSRVYPNTRAPHRPYKARVARGRPQNHNMSLTNGRKPVKIGRRSVKSVKYSDKQCSRFSTSGVCPHGLTCRYQHDPSKIAICWPFLQSTCPNTAETCPLSHNPTPERTPLCVHFANAGRCKNGSACLFPHVRVGARNGVCRDFAVLGYCEKGVDCDKQHVRECPDFAEKGVCPNKKCKLPHVIRANNRRKNAVDPTGSAPTSISAQGSQETAGQVDDTAMKTPLSSGSGPVVTTENANIGDEYISLTFHESDDELDDYESGDGEDGDEAGEEGDMGDMDEDEDEDAEGVSDHEMDDDSAEIA